MNMTQPHLTGTIEYLEKNLAFFRRQLRTMAKKASSKPAKLYGSLSKIDLSFQDFKKLRRQISSSWEQKWS